MDQDVVVKTFKQCNMYEGTVIGNWSHKMAYRMIMDKQGAIINGYAAGNIDNLLSIIDKVVVYEDANPCNLNGFARAENMKDQVKWTESKQGVKDGLLELYAYYDENREMIKQKRIENGLENN